MEGSYEDMAAAAVEGPDEKQRERRRRLVTGLRGGIVAGVAVTLLGAGSCDKQAPLNNPLPCVTQQGLDGRWYDSDGEVVDEDPCDGRDVVHRTTKPPSKPAVSPAKPAPRTTRR